jgi:hypothetical protein
LKEEVLLSKPTEQTQDFTLEQRRKLTRAFTRIARRAKFRLLLTLLILNLQKIRLDFRYTLLKLKRS